MCIDLPAAFSQIIDQLFARFQLAARRLIAIEIADQTNAKSDVVEVIAVHVAAIDLPPPAIANLDLAVTGGRAITDDKMISESIFHAANVAVVVIENAGAALTCATVMNDDELPATSHHWRAINFIPH